MKGGDSGSADSESRANANPRSRSGIGARIAIAADMSKVSRKDRITQPPVRTITYVRMVQLEQWQL
jgi:hypothetical protein